MHRVTVTPLPATPQDEPIEVGSYWRHKGDSSVMLVIVVDPVFIRTVCLTTGMEEVDGIKQFREQFTRLRNVRIEIEVQ